MPRCATRRQMCIWQCEAAVQVCKTVISIPTCTVPTSTTYDLQYTLQLNTQVAPQNSTKVALPETLSVWLTRSGGLVILTDAD